jgi:hypothetical protein
MRRLILSLILVVLSVLASGVLAPVAPRVHAQTYTSPTVTVTPSTVTAGSTATIQGYAFTPNNWVFVYWQRPDGTTNGTWVFSNATGSFTMTLGFSPSHGTGTEYVAGFDYGTGRWSPFVAVTVTSGGPPPATRYLTASPNPVVVGSMTTVAGYGFSRNNWVYVQWMRPDGTTNAVWVFTDATGYFTFQLGFLASHGCGSETLQAYDYGAGVWSPPYTVTVTGC